MIQKIHKTMYLCRCECKDAKGVPCGYEWESNDIPERCSKCKRRTWNSQDNRMADKKATHVPPQRKAPRRVAMKLPKPTRVRALDEI